LALTRTKYAGVLLNLFERHDIAAGINQLRDAVAQTDYARAGADEEARARENLEQADENIYAALAGAVASIDEEIQGYEKSLRFTNLNEQYGRYQELSGILTMIKRQIKSSQADREQRDSLYRYAAEGADFKAALKYFDELRGSIGAIRESVTREKIRSGISLLFQLISTSLLALGVFAAISMAA